MISETGSEIVIRKLRREDCTSAAKFCKYTMNWMYEKYLEGTYPREASEFDTRMKSSASLAGRLKDPNAYGFVALSEDKICGVVLGMIYSKSGLSKINWIAVDPKHHHEGIGINLMIYTEEYLKSKGCHKFFLNTLPPLTPAIKLYMKFGMLPESYLRKHWWGVDFIVMSKWIGEYRRRR